MTNDELRALLADFPGRDSVVLAVLDPTTGERRRVDVVDAYAAKAEFAVGDDEPGHWKRIHLPQCFRLGHPKAKARMDNVVILETEIEVTLPEKGPRA